jgi:hypothetical protein
MKPISPLMHGILDYLASGTYFALPGIRDWDQRATNVMTGAGGVALVYSLFTCYPLGLIKLLPMRAHLAIDGLFSASVLGAALFLKDEKAEVRGTMAGMALFGAIAALLTRPFSGVQKRRYLAR